MRSFTLQNICFQEEIRTLESTTKSCTIFWKQDIVWRNRTRVPTNCKRNCYPKEWDIFVLFCFVLFSVFLCLFGFLFCFCLERHSPVWFIAILGSTRLKTVSPSTDKCLNCQKPNRWKYSPWGWGGLVTPYTGLYGEAPPERAAILWLQCTKGWEIVFNRYFKGLLKCTHIVAKSGN